MGKERIKKRLAINPEEAEVVRLIYSLYLSHNMGAKAIAEQLNREGHLYRGRKWQKNRVLDIIGDEAYIGRYYFNRKDSKTNRLKPKEEWVLIQVEPIIDRDLWERAKALKEERAPSNTHSNPAIVGSKSLLTGLAICGLCDARMTLETAKGGKFTYYNCSNYIRRGKSTCPGQRIPAHKLEQTILDHMANKLFTKDRVKGLLKGMYGEIRAMDKRNEGQRKSLVRQLDVIKTKLTRQFEAIEEGIIDLHDVAERIRELKDRRKQIEDRLEEIRPRKTIPLHFFKDNSIEAFQGTIKELFLGEDNREMTKRYLQLFIEKIVINIPLIEIRGRPEAILAFLENKKVARHDVLTTKDFWLPGTDSNRRPSG